MKDYKDLIEIYDRYCPICGKMIKKGSSVHRCSQKKINEIDKKNEEEESEEDRTMDDKLMEFEKYYNPEKYYDIEE